MKTIEILVGIQCSGKSTYCKDKWNLANNSDNIEYPVTLSRDNIRETNQFSQPYVYSKYNEDIVTDIYNAQLRFALRQTLRDVILLDNTHCEEKYIDDIISKYGKDNKIIVKFFDISLSKAQYRNIIRYFKTGKWIPIRTINQFYKNYNKINKKKYEQYKC